jgi:hypothetical protein
MQLTVQLADSAAGTSWIVLDLLLLPKPLLIVEVEHPPPTDRATTRSPSRSADMRNTSANRCCRAITTTAMDVPLRRRGVAKLLGLLVDSTVGEMVGVAEGLVGLRWSPPPRQLLMLVLLLRGTCRQYGT